MFQKKFLKYYVLGIVLAAVVGVTSVIVWIAPYIFVKKVTNEQLDELNLEGYDKLMIVAHPDDELIWGGCHLLEDDYLVVCITNGDNETRSGEFARVNAATGDKGLILSYPDKMFGKRSNWTLQKKSIKNDIANIVNYKDWETIVTHNIDGEYGHVHHKMTHKLVAEVCEETDTDATQYYFGKYYGKNKVPDNLERVDENLLKQKEEIAKIYESQEKTINKFRHMFAHELWQENGN